MDTDYFEDDYSSVRIIVVRGHPDGIPIDLWVANEDGLGSAFQIDILCTWCREDRLDGNGHLGPYFSNGRGNGSDGPPSRGHPDNGPLGLVGHSLPRFKPLSAPPPARDLLHLLVA